MGCWAAIEGSVATLTGRLEGAVGCPQQVVDALPNVFSFVPKGILGGADKGGQLHIVLQQVGEQDIISILPCFVSCLVEPV